MVRGTVPRWRRPLRGLRLKIIGGCGVIIRFREGGRENSFFFNFTPAPLVGKLGLCPEEKPTRRVPSTYLSLNVRRETAVRPTVEVLVA